LTTATTIVGISHQVDLTAIGQVVVTVSKAAVNKQGTSIAGGGMLKGEVEQRQEPDQQRSRCAGGKL
jgi:hypothetical protein